MGSLAYGQSYSTTFDANPPIAPANSLSGQDGWNTNDAFKASEAGGGDVGQSDYVGPINYSGSTNLGGFSGNQGALGGLFHGTGTNQQLPGSSTVYLYHAFSPGASTSIVFNTDLDITFPSSGTTTGTPNTTRDSFGFNFQTSGLTTLFSLNFTPDTNGTSMNIGYTSAAGTTPTVNAILYNSVYHLRITANVVTGATTAVFTGSSNSFTITTTAAGLAGVQQIAATWILKNTTTDATGGYINAGSNALIFDNFSIAVPEPSTWAMLGVGVLGLALYARRRVRA